MLFKPLQGFTFVYYPQTRPAAIRTRTEALAVWTHCPTRTSNKVCAFGCPVECFRVVVEIAGVVPMLVLVQYCGGLRTIELSVNYSLHLHLLCSFAFGFG